MATKFKNIVGSAFLPYVADQFAKRSSIVKKIQEQILIYNFLQIEMVGID